ncbi:MAG: ADP-ribosyltransferase domain-containing protein [Bdellovibrionales bacterium]|nr:ADP-ribosyltransferase domain-containing protein [Bdellovibrionales bacterium]
MRVLDAALKKIPNEAKMTVFRGTARAHIQFKKKGEIVRLKGYTSTSPSQEVAEEFIRDRLMVLTVTSGKDISSYSNAGGEREVLLPRSTYVRYDGSEMKEMNIFTEEGPELRLIEVVYLTEVSVR